MSDSRLLCAADVAQMIGRSLRTTHRLAALGRIPSRTKPPAATWTFDRDQIQAWIDEEERRRVDDLASAAAFAEGKMARPIVLRRVDAVRVGLKRYFTGKECAKGHVAERMVSSKACCACSRLNATAWAKTNSKLVNRRRWEHRKLQPETALNHRLWYVANKERCAARQLAWQRANRVAVCAYGQKRRAFKMGNGGSYSAADISHLLKIQKNRCAHSWCRVLLKKGYHVDHKMPLALGGSNNYRNIQLLCQSCNQRKGAKHPITFARANGLLL